MPKEVEPKNTTRAAAYALWMKAPNPMVTFFKTFDVTNLIKVSRKRNLKFNMLLDYCIGRAAAGVKEFYILPVGDVYKRQALGFDTLAAQCVLSLKKQYPHIKLILVLPCITQTKGWSKDDIAVYEEIKSQADKVVYTSHDYFQGCMFKRNRHLVNGSSVCIAYLTQEKGGTAYTVSYTHL